MIRSTNLARHVPFETSGGPGLASTNSPDLGERAINGSVAHGRRDRSYDAASSPTAATTTAAATTAALATPQTMTKTCGTASTDQGLKIDQC